MKILVTTANGHTGFPTAKELLNLGFEVKALVRNPNSKNAQTLKKLGAEIFIGDMHDVRDYREALKDVQRAYFCTPVHKNTLYKTATFVSAAEEANLEHVVYMSQWLLSEDHHAINTKEQWLSDEVIKLHKKVNYTFVNPGMFGYIYFFTNDLVSQLGMMPVPVKGASTQQLGLNAPPSEEDQGRVIAHILKDPAKHIGKTYRPTGPKLVSFIDVANIFGKILGREVKVNEISTRLFNKSLKAASIFGTYEITNFHYYMDELGKNTFAVGGGVTNVVKEITGRNPEDFETIARRFFANAPEIKPSLSNKLKAIRGLMKTMFTRIPDMKQTEIDLEYPQYMNGMEYAQKNPDWVKFHEDKSNYSIQTQ